MPRSRRRSPIRRPPARFLSALAGVLLVIGLAATATVGPGTGYLPPGSPPGPARAGRADGQPQPDHRPGARGGSGPRGRARPQPGEPLAPVPAGVTMSDARMSYAGRQRTWLLATPRREPAGERLPLFMDLHGRGAGPAYAARQSGLLTAVAQGAAIAVFPSGYLASWNADGCCGLAARRRVDDLGFLRALVQRLAARPDVDATRLAVLGFSNGGRMALDLACSRYLSGDGLRLDAVVAVEAINSSRCVRGPGIPTLVTAGTDDPFVGYDEPTRDPEGGRLPSAQQELVGWSSSENCTVSDSSAGSFPLERFTCADGPLELLTIPGGRHRWPAAINPVIGQFLQTAMGLPA